METRCDGFISALTTRYPLIITPFLRFLRREHLHAERVYLAAHARSQCGVDELMALNHALAAELLSDDHRLEVRVIIGKHPDLRARQTGLYQGLDFSGVHEQYTCNMQRRGDISSSVHRSLF